mmetsp:Transcript_8347/g.9309  ORF Transcript_8347/g.9309 Transcript_8347/m.9309 type:complete len:514 (+) Transcript_8347:36-1577(+)
MLKSLLAILFLNFLVTITCLNYFGSSPPVVQTKNGPVQGYYNTTEALPFTYFHGIPYATPPIGDKRFQAPQPVDDWNKIIDAKDFKEACVQGGSMYTLDQTSEDCLYLNVFTPMPMHSETPVLLFIYGGSFLYGGTSLYPGGQLAAQTDSIVVTISYRLDVFGFYYNEDNKQHENVGLQDQALAIKWVYENIHAFGGNPSTLTVFGESAGGMSTLLQSILPPTIQTVPIRALIAESPGPWRLPSKETSMKITESVLQLFDCSNTECLKKVPAKTLMTETQKSGLSYYPTVGGTTITAQPLSLLQDGLYRKYPMIIGTQEYEGNIFMFQNSGKTPAEGIDEAMYNKIVAESFAGYSSDFIELVKSWYVPYTKARGYWEGASKIFGDSGIACGVHLASPFIGKFQPDSYFRYHFTKFPEGPNSFLNATHASELAYIFQHQSLFFNGTFSQDDVYVSHSMAAYWKSMAVLGVPGAPWKSFFSDSDVLEFNVPLEMKTLDDNTWSYCNNWQDILTKL